MTRRLFTAALLVAALASSATASNENPNSKRLVEISVTRHETDPFLPWQKARPGKRNGYGVVVRKNIILTTETLVRNSKVIEINLPRSEKKLRGRSMLVDIQSNLALIELLDEAETLPQAELPLADALPMDAKTTICQTDDTSAIQTCDGTVIQVSMSRVSSASFLMLSCKLLTEPAVYNQGAPVFSDGKLAGITINHKRSDRECLMIPAPVIRRFLNDAKEPPYSGFPSAGFYWAKLVDPAKRKFLGLPKDQEQGIEILSTIPGSGSDEKLKPSDVILSIDGSKVDSLGYYKDQTHGRLLFPYLINGRRSAGESIEMTVFRDKKEIELTIPLSPWKDSMSLIPEDHEAQMNDYIASGGLIMRELSGRYLRAHGGDWESRVGPRLAYYYETIRSAPEQPGDRIVILAGILPDTVNIGYQHVRNEIVTHVNGNEIRNIQDVFDAVDKEGGLRTVKLKSLDIELVFDAEELEEANERILSSYRIPAIDSRKLEELENKGF